MNDTGEVARAIVIQVLRSHGVAVTPQEDGPEGMMILAKGDRLEAKALPTKCGRKLLHYLARHYGMAIYAFFNVEPAELEIVPTKKPSGNVKEAS